VQQIRICNPEAVVLELGRRCVHLVTDASDRIPLGESVPRYRSGYEVEGCPGSAIAGVCEVKRIQQCLHALLTRGRAGRGTRLTLDYVIDGLQGGSSTVLSTMSPAK
jgi:hypothetical protein